MYPIAINVNAPSKLDTVICVVVPQSTEGEVAPLAPALLSVTDINGMSLKGSSKYIEHLLFMFALTSEDIVNCIMRSLSIFIFLRVAFLQFVTLLVTSLFSTLNKFSTVENLIKVDTGITGDYTTVGKYSYTFPKNYKRVLGVSLNIYKQTTATTLENVYLVGFNNIGFTFVKDCVDNTKSNTVKISYSVFYMEI